MTAEDAGAMRRHHINEVPLAQCDKCGSEVPPDQITEGDPFYEVKIFVVGLICGGFLRLLFTWLQHLELV